MSPPDPHASSLSGFAPLDLVALLHARPHQGLARGQVGTVIGAAPDDTLIVRFRNGSGAVLAEAPVPREQLLKLVYDGTPPQPPARR